jgi:hypothetical protein
MPDITMCPGGNCQMRQSCHRYTAEPSSRQAYFVEPPFVLLQQPNNGNPAGTCAHLMPQPEKQCHFIE